MSDVDERRKRLLDALVPLCEEVIGPNATDVDRAARNPVESWAGFAEIGALALKVPVEHGGLLVDQLTYLEIISTIARYCAASAMTLHMHSVACETVALIANSEQQAKIFALPIEQGKLIGSWGSEPGVSFSLKLSSETVATPKGDGYVLNGFKYFCTMASGAGGAIVLVAIADSDAEGAPIDFGHVFLTKDQPEQDIIGVWDPLGMRGTVSPGIRFTDVMLSSDFVFKGTIKSGVLENLSMLPGFGAVMLGVAESCLNATRDYLKSKRYVTQDSTMDQDPTVQRHMGDMATQLAAARIVLMDSAKQWDTGRRYLLAARGKLAVTKAVVYVANQCMQLVGGNAATKALPIERALRDIRTSSLMPPSIDRMEQIVGSDYLDVGARLFK